MQFLWLLLNEIAFLSGGSVLPGCTFEDQTVDVCTVFRVGVHLFSCLHKRHIGLEGHVVQRQNLFSGGGLHDGGEETHGVEEMADAEGVGGDQLSAPFVELGASFDQFIEPQAEILSAGVGFFLP